MSVLVRTSKNSGVSVPWIVAPFIMLAVMTYWLIWLVAMTFVWGVRLSTKAVALVYALLTSRSGRHT